MGPVRSLQAHPKMEHVRKEHLGASIHSTWMIQAWKWPTWCNWLLHWRECSQTNHSSHPNSQISGPRPLQRERSEEGVILLMSDFSLLGAAPGHQPDGPVWMGLKSLQGRSKQAVWPQPMYRLFKLWLSQSSAPPLRYPFGPRNTKGLVTGLTWV